MALRCRERVPPMADTDLTIHRRVEIRSLPLPTGAIRRWNICRGSGFHGGKCMRRSFFAAVSLSPLLLLALVGLGRAQAPDAPRVSGPFAHANLAVYFIHGRSTPGKVPLSLDEAMARGIAKVRETSNVNELEIENLGNDEVFVQAGDIVKGGQQDRTLMVSLVLPPKSGRIPIASFCVEEGRWSARGREDAKSFATSSASVPSRELKLAMKAPKPAPAPAPTAGGNLPGSARPLSNAGVSETSLRQREVWDEVAKAQSKLSGNVGARVQSSQSASSLQLALENDRLLGAQKDYLATLKPAGEADG